jgi:hypothetical protein
MNSSVNEKESVSRAKKVRVTDERITIEFKDGRSVSVPTKWYPRLLHGNTAERSSYEIWDDGVYWPALNADISYQGILEGKKSGECAKSFRRWMRYHSRGEQELIPTFPLPAEMANAIKQPNRPTRKLAKAGK